MYVTGESGEGQICECLHMYVCVYTYVCDLRIQQNTMENLVRDTYVTVYLYIYMCIYIY